MEISNEVWNVKDGNEKHYLSDDECVAWLEKEITKEDERVYKGDTKTGLRRWVLSIMKNMVLSNSELKNEILNEVRTNV